jgi:hypothetical protein
MMRIFYCDSNQIRHRYYVIYIKIKATDNNSTYWSARRKPVMLIWFRANLWPCSRHFLYYYFLHLLSTYFHSPPRAQALSLEHIRTTIRVPPSGRDIFHDWKGWLSSSGRSHSTKMDCERLSCGCPERRIYARAREPQKEILHLEN